MIGGMVGNNSSGSTSIRYGVTRDKVLQIDGVLSDGSLVSFKELTSKEFKLTLVSEKIRINYLEKKFGLKNIIYMGDGIFDAEILKKSFYGIAPKNSRIEARQSADFITQSNSGEGAVLDACLKIRNKFF